MKLKKSLVIASAVVVPLALGMSAGPASAAPKNCLSMRLAYEQASLASTHAESVMVFFEDMAQDYVDANGYYRVKGWLYDRHGGIVDYDWDTYDWQAFDDIYRDQAAQAEADEADAYDTYVSYCAF